MVVRSRFRCVVGCSPEVKVLEWLCECPDGIFTFNDVVLSVGLNRKRAYSFLKDYLAWGLLVKDVKVKQIQFYRLNVGSSGVGSLLEFFEEVKKNRRIK